MSSPGSIPQGTINRLRASVLWSDFPGLNVTSQYLDKAGIRISFEGDSTLFIDTMTGRVTSPEPYLRITATMALLKTQPLSSAYKAQMETLATIGNGIIRPDTTTLTPYPIVNCAIQGVRELNFDGTNAGYVVTIGGTYYINSSLFS